jgi:starch-binding outer membrane protein, SusD/RagB family
MKNFVFNIKFLGIISLFLVGSSCKKMLDLRPENLTLSEEALKTPADIQALLNSCYDEFANLMNGSVQNMHELLGENVAEPQNSAGSLYYTIYNRGTFSFRTADREYLDFYNCILRINTIFENIDKIPGLSNDEKARIMGEGHFLRAWCHWELVKLWAQPYGYTADNSHPGVPIRLKADKNIEIRSSVDAVYRQVLTDLNTSIGLLPIDNGNYANQDGAKALKAKVLFLMNDFIESSKITGELIGSGKYQISDSLNRFVQGAPEEVIFQLISTSINDNRASAFINNYRSDNNPNPALKPSASFMKDAMSAIDLRSAFFEVKNQGNTNQFFINLKFNKDVFHVPLLHYTDMILMHAESITENGGDLSQAISLIDGIRKRAYGTEFVATNPAINATDLKEIIRKERKIEMAFEGDWTQQLRRRGAKGENITIRQSKWDCPGMLIQFPMSEKTSGFKFNEEGGCN